MQPNKWNEVGASYDHDTGVAQLWHDGKMVKSRNIGQIELRTQFPVRIGADGHDKRQFKGKISCVQIYDRALTSEQVGSLRTCPVNGNIYPFSLDLVFRTTLNVTGLITHYCSVHIPNYHICILRICIFVNKRFLKHTFIIAGLNDGKEKTKLTAGLYK